MNKRAGNEQCTWIAVAVKAAVQPLHQELLLFILLLQLLPQLHSLGELAGVAVPEEQEGSNGSKQTDRDRQTEAGAQNYAEDSAKLLGQRHTSRR